MDTKRPRDRDRRRALTTQAIAEHARGSDGIIGTPTLLDLGLSRRSIDRRVATGLLFRVAPDVYGVTPGKPSTRGTWRAALLTVPGDTWLASITSAQVMDLGARRRGDAVHVLHRGPGRWPRPGLQLHRTEHLPPTDVTEVDGFPCTAFARTVLDSAAIVEEDRLNEMLDRGVMHRLYDGVAIERVLRERPNARGGAALTAAVARLDATAGEHRSAFERRTTALIRESSMLPTPSVNSPLGRFRPDLGFFGTRALIECDGRDYHRSPAQILSDERREIALLVAGYVILRLRWNQVVHEPARTLARIERFYQANRDAPVRGVAGTVVF